MFVIAEIQQTNRHDVVAFFQGLVLLLHFVSSPGAIMRMHSYENLMKS